MNCIKTAVATAAVATFPAVAFAVPVGPDFFESYGEDLLPGEEVSWSFDPLEELEFFLSTSGSGEYEDLLEVTYVLGGETYTYDSVDEPTKGLEGASGTIPSFTTSEDFTVFARLSEEAMQQTGVTLSIKAASVAPIPTPAAGALLLGGLGALGVMRRRKS